MTEVVGIGVLPEFRGRGLGQAISDLLARTALTSGCDVAFLSAAGASQAAIYARAGFVMRSPMVYMALPEDAAS